MHNNKKRNLFITEGPFDMMVLHYFLYKNEIDGDATCLFGINASKKQLSILNTLHNYYNKIFILFDSGFSMTAVQLKLKVSHDNIHVLDMPSGYDDPGNLDLRGFNEIIRTVGL